MSSYSKDLIKKGFINSKGKKIKSQKTDMQWEEFLKNISDDEAEKYADEEHAEEIKINPASPYNDYVVTGFPKPFKRYKLIFESPEAAIEESYYWVLSQLRTDLSYSRFIKVTDTFAASEQSSLWGAASQRLKIQQDSVSQYMATIGNMLKNLFQLVRELRIMDERIELYDNCKKSKSADVTLKGLYVDLVEGATKNPGSVYGLAQNVGFTILPDLFFNTHIISLDSIDQKVELMDYNEQVKNVLRRKLYSYVNWREKTDDEIRHRRNFQIKYLRQHWATIGMYMDWLKPYLRNVRRMHQNDKFIESVDLISAFETAITEVEFIATQQTRTGTYPVILANFKYVTRPELSFQKDQYAHKGPAHNGKMEMEFRAYTWTQKQIDNYVAYRKEEGMKMFSILDESVKAAMDALGTDLEKYLEIAEEKGFKKKDNRSGIPDKAKRRRTFGILGPFIAIFQGFWEIFNSLIPVGDFLPDKKKPSGPKKDKNAIKAVNATMWLCYKNYKKAHKMITW